MGVVREASDQEDDGEESALWHRLRHGQDDAARTALIEKYLWLARAIATKAYSRYRQPSLELRDLIQAASVAVMEAMGRFDPSLGIRFATFASKRVAGAVQDLIDASTEEHAQYAAKRRIKKERVDSLRPHKRRKGRDALQELADVAIGLAIGIMLEGTTLYANADDASAPYVSNHIAVLREQFTRLIDTLPERERQIVRYHYYYEMEFTDIASLLRVGKARVSQLHAQALRRLREAHRDLSAFDLSC